MRTLRCGKASPLVKLCSCLVAIAFIVNFVLTDAWAVIPVGVPGPARPAVEELSKLDVETFFLPPDLGTVKYSKKADPNKVIVHIQDAHCNYEAQIKVFQIIKFLREEYGIDMVNLEGGVGNYDLSAFEEIEDEVRRDEVGDYFVGKGLINGAELFAIENPGEIKLWGVEDEGLYIKNLEVYRESLLYGEEVDAHIKVLSHILANLKRNIYSDELLEIDDKYMAFKGGDIEFKVYLEYLLDKSRTKRINIKQYANVYLLSQSLEQEDKIDFKKANKERERLIDDLEGRLSPKELRELLKKTIQFKGKKISQFDFYEFLIKSAKKAGYKMDDYPELQKFIIYVSLYNAVDKFKIMQELDEVEVALKETVYENDMQPQLDKLSKHLVLIENMFDIRFTKDDYLYYRENRGAFDVSNFVEFIEEEAPKYKISAVLDETIVELDEYREKIFAFYEYSFERDGAFLENLRMTGGEVRSGVLVSGGFHAENLCELFDENDYSYVSIIPTFKNPKGYESPYFTLLSGKLDRTMTSLRGVFAGESLMQIASMLTRLADGVWDGATTEAFRAWVFIESQSEEPVTDIAVSGGNIEVTYENGKTEAIMTVEALQTKMTELNVESLLARAIEQRENMNMSEMIAEMRRLQKERDQAESSEDEIPPDEGLGKATIPALERIFGSEWAVAIEEILLAMLPFVGVSLLGLPLTFTTYMAVLGVIGVGFLAAHQFTGERKTLGDRAKLLIVPALVLLVVGGLGGSTVFMLAESLGYVLANTSEGFFIGLAIIGSLIATGLIFKVRMATHMWMNDTFAGDIALKGVAVSQITSNPNAQRVLDGVLKRMRVPDRRVFLEKAFELRQSIDKQLASAGIGKKDRADVIERMAVTPSEYSPSDMLRLLKLLNGNITFLVKNDQLVPGASADLIIHALKTNKLLGVRRVAREVGGGKTVGVRQGALARATIPALASVVGDRNAVILEEIMLAAVPVAAISLTGQALNAATYFGALAIAAIVFVFAHQFSPDSKTLSDRIKLGILPLIVSIVSGLGGSGLLYLVLDGLDYSLAGGAEGFVIAGALTVAAALTGAIMMAKIWAHNYINRNFAGDISLQKVTLKQVVYDAQIRQDLKTKRRSPVTAKSLQVLYAQRAEIEKDLASLGVPKVSYNQFIDALAIAPAETRPGSGRYDLNKMHELLKDLKGDIRNRLVPAEKNKAALRGAKPQLLALAYNKATGKDIRLVEARVGDGKTVAIRQESLSRATSIPVRDFLMNNAVLKRFRINMSRETYNAFAGVIEEPLFRFASLLSVQLFTGLSAFNPIVFGAWAILSTIIFAKAHPGGVKEKSGAYIVSAISVAATAIVMGYFNSGVMGIVTAGAVASITHTLFNKGVDYYAGVTNASDLKSGSVEVAMENAEDAAENSLEYDFAQRVSNKMLDTARENADIDMQVRFLNEVPVRFWGESDVTNSLAEAIVSFAGENQVNESALCDKILTEALRLEDIGEDSVYLDNMIAELSLRPAMLEILLSDSAYFPILSRAYETDRAGLLREAITSSDVEFPDADTVDAWLKYMARNAESPEESSDYQLASDLASAMLARLDTFSSRNVFSLSPEEFSQSDDGREGLTIISRILSSPESVDVIAIADNENALGRSMGQMITSGTFGESNSKRVFNFVRAGLDVPIVNINNALSGYAGVLDQESYDVVKARLEARNKRFGALRRYSRGLSRSLANAISEVGLNVDTNDMVLGFVLDVSPRGWAAADSDGKMLGLISGMLLEGDEASEASSIGQRVSEALSRPVPGAGGARQMEYLINIVNAYTENIEGLTAEGRNKEAQSMLRDMVLNITPEVLDKAADWQNIEDFVYAMVRLAGESSIEPSYWQNEDLLALMKNINGICENVVTREYGEELSNMITRSIGNVVAERRATNDVAEKAVYNRQIRSLLRPYLVRVSPANWRGDAIVQAITNLYIAEANKTSFYDDLKLAVIEARQIDSSRESYAILLTNMIMRSIQWNLDKRREALDGEVRNYAAADRHLKAAINLFNVASSWSSTERFGFQPGVTELMPIADEDGTVMGGIFEYMLSKETLIDAGVEEYRQQQSEKGNNDVVDVQGAATGMLKMIIPELSGGADYFVGVSEGAILETLNGLKVPSQKNPNKYVWDSRINLRLRREMDGIESATKDGRMLIADRQAVKAAEREKAEVSQEEMMARVADEIGEDVVDTVSDEEKDLVTAALTGQDYLDVTGEAPRDLGPGSETGLDESARARFYRNALNNFVERGQVEAVMRLANTLESYSLGRTEYVNTVNAFVEVVNEASSSEDFQSAAMSYMGSNGISVSAIEGYVTPLIEQVGVEEGDKLVLAKALQTVVADYLNSRGIEVEIDAGEVEETIPERDSEAKVTVEEGVVTIDSKDAEAMNEANDWDGIFEGVQAVGKEVLDSVSRNMFSGDACIINIPVSQKMFGKPMAAVLGKATKVRSRSSRMIKVYKLGNITINVFNDTDAGRAELIEKLKDSGVPQQQMVTYMFDQATGAPDNKQAQRRELMGMSYAIRLDGEVGETATPIDGCTLAAIKILDHNSRGEMEPLEFQESINMIAKALGAIAGISDSATIEEIAKAIVDNGKLRASGMLLIKIRPIDTNEIVEYYEAAAEIMRSL